MISRSTLIGALVVVELALLGMMAQALAGGRASAFPATGAVAWWPTHTDHVLPFDVSVAAGTAPRVLIDAPRYRVTVVTAPGATVRAVGSASVHGFVDGLPATVTLERTADGVRVHAPDRAVNVMLGEVMREVQVTVPPDASVEASAARNLSVTGLRARLMTRLDNAKVVVHDHRGDVDVSSANGRIELHDVTGERVVASSSNGRLVLNAVDARFLDVHTANGNVQADALRVTEGRIASGNGRISVAFDPGSDATITASSGNGHIRCREPSTTPDGGRTRVVTLGGGHGQFSVSSGNGRITII